MPTYVSIYIYAYTYYIQHQPQNFNGQPKVGEILKNEEVYFLRLGLGCSLSRSRLGGSET